jgi:hypothetical protein
MSADLEYDHERDMAIRRRVHWVACPTCQAPEGAGCRARNSGHPTALHRTRIDAAEKAVDADRAKPQTGRIRWTDGTLKGSVGDALLFEISDVRLAGQGWGLRSLVGDQATYTSGHATLDEAKAEAERMLDQSDGDHVNARRAEQAKALLARHKKLRATLPARTDDPGVGDELLDEMAALAPLRAKVNAKYLD